MRGSELTGGKKMEVWECFLEEAGLQLDSVTLRTVKPPTEGWPWGDILLVLGPHAIP